MIQRCEELGFPLETRQALCVLGELIGKYFDRDLAPELGVRCAIDLTSSR